MCIQPIRVWGPFCEILGVPPGADTKLQSLSTAASKWASLVERQEMSNVVECETFRGLVDVGWRGEGDRCRRREKRGGV